MMVPSFSHIHRLNKTLYIQESPYAIFEEPKNEGKEQLVRVEEGTQLEFFRRNAAEGQPFRWILTPFPGAQNSESLRNIQVQLTPIEASNFLENTLLPAKSFEPGMRKFEYIHLQIMSFHSMINAFLAESREPVIIARTELNFFPDNSLCLDDEVALAPIIRRRDPRFGQTRMRDLKLPEGMPLLIYESEYREIVCMKVASLIVSGRPLGSQPDREKVPWQWSKQQEADLYKRLGQYQISLFPDFHFDQMYDHFEVENGGHEFHFIFEQALIGSCEGECRLQGFNIVLNQNGRLVRVQRDVTTADVMTFQRNLYYYTRSEGEVPFEEGDWARIEAYSNDKEFLTQRYRELETSYFGAYDQNFTATMTRVYREISEPSSRRHRKAGSAMVTFFVALSQA
ncbi:MAG: hypothetical protein AAF202_05980, partial [Pseudomonadota bacterium]